ncbi:MAG: hypothetical protein HY690_15740 [Chloroflexi bacterium]|nr:hypothetical protein [Chloroflexota bacterium]
MPRPTWPAATPTLWRAESPRGKPGSSAAPVRRAQVIDPYREQVEEWVEQSHGRIRADVAQRKLETLRSVRTSTQPASTN